MTDVLELIPIQKLKNALDESGSGILVLRFNRADGAIPLLICVASEETMTDVLELIPIQKLKNALDESGSGILVLRFNRADGAIPLLICVASEETAAAVSEALRLIEENDE